jgi:large subunit ribosomal protein L6
MKKELYQTIEIPEGIEVKIEGSELTVKGPEGENKKTFNTIGLDFEVKGNEIVVGSKKATKREKKLMNTIAAHIKNLIRGVQEKFEYKLKICFSHFPMTVDIQGDKATIKNFLGEKINRSSRIPQGAEVQVDKEIVTVTSTDKEIAGQAAANFEKATRIPNKDRRVFQDGIFITHKDGREM